MRSAEKLPGQIKCVAHLWRISRVLFVLSSRLAASSMKPEKPAA